MKIRLAYAANRKIGFLALKILLKYGIKPVVILLPENGDYNEKIISLVKDLPYIIGKSFKDKGNIEFLRSLDLDYILSVHFPYIIPKEIIDIPKIGVLNLHPSYLPFNRGWHTATWAIYESTPFGVTLHWVDQGIDTGDIALQKEIPIFITDTADKLYKRAIRYELKVLKEAIPFILNKNLPRIPQPKNGTFHFKKDIHKIRKIDLNSKYTLQEFIKILRSLTTNSWDEAAFFEYNNKKILIRIQLKESKK